MLRILKAHGTFESLLFLVLCGVIVGMLVSCAPAPARPGASASAGTAVSSPAEDTGHGRQTDSARIASIARRLEALEKRCPDGPAADESVASSIGLSLSELDLLKTNRCLSNEDICSMEPPKLARAIFKAVYSPMKPDQPQEWAKLRAMQQASEDGQVKPDGLVKANTQRQAILQTTGSRPLAAGISRSDWTFIGPQNIGGRIRSIVIHPTEPSRMWIGSVSGGIWASTDGGATWSPVDDFMGNLAVSTLVMDPSDSNVMYAGTGEGFFNIDAVRGYGVFKSIDGGATWSHLASTLPSNDINSPEYSWYYVNRLAMSTNSVLLAATRDYYGGAGAIYRSTDGGTTWTSTFKGMIWDVKFSPLDPSKAVASGLTYNYSTNKYESYILMSLDSGNTWLKSKTFAGSDGRIELAYAPSDPQIVYAVRDNNSGEVYKSTDGASTWILVSTPKHLGGQGWYDNAVWVSPTSPNLVVVAGIDAYRSTDGGVRWTQISVWWKWPQSAHADHHAIVNHPGYDGVSNKRVFFGTDGGLFEAPDIRKSDLHVNGWTYMNDSLGITQFYGGAGGVSSGSIIGGTQDNGHLMSTGGSTIWTQTYGGDGGFAAVDQDDNNYMYGEYVGLSLYRSSDGGRSYEHICNGITEAYYYYCGGTSEALFIAPFILDPNNQSTMLAGAASLWRSTDVKAVSPSWSAIKPRTSSGGVVSFISAIAVAEGSSDIIWVGHDKGSIFYTTNGTSANPEWVRVDNGTNPLPNRYVTRILIDRDDHDKVYAAFGGYEADNLYVTTDSGATWKDASGNLPSAPVRSVLRHPTIPGWLYAGTEVGVFTSENGGSIWSTTNDGPANVSVDELFWYGPDEIVAVTHGRGMFKAAVDTTPSRPVVSSFKIDNGAASTRNAEVTLNNVVWGSSPTIYAASELADFKGADWLPYSTAPTMTLSAGYGVKSIYFKVKDGSGAESDVVSDKIRYKASPPTITVKSPNGEQVWKRGSSHSITWSYTEDPGPYLKIVLLKSGSVVKSISSKAATKSRSCSWKVPSSLKPGADYKVRITSTARPSCTDISDRSFTIK